jgi:hypothetical protein
MNITRGKTHPAPRVVVYGPSGVGKSSFACGVDHPSTSPRKDVVAIDYESGLDEIGVARVRGPDGWEESLKLVREACAGQGDYTTIAIDTIDRLEEQATRLVCTEGKKKSLADFGYGDGFEALVTKWRELLFVLESAREKQRTVILVAHVQQKPQDDPRIGKYDKYVAAMQKRCWGATHRWADAVLFADYERGLHEGRAIMTGTRELHTCAGTGFDAKNRWGLPPVLPLSWAAFDRERVRRLRSTDEVKASIVSLIRADDDASKLNEHLTAAGDDVSRLCVIETALLKKRKETVAA